MISKLKDLVTEYEIAAITKQNFPQIMEIYDSNYDYFMLTNGEKARVENCLEDIEKVPPSFDKRNKIFIGFWRNEKAVAILDLLEGYPDNDCCWIGLLLVQQELQGEGIGHKIVDAVTKAAQLKGYTSLQLGVIENNKKAIMFWEKMGFIITRVNKVKRSNKADWDVIIMEKHII